MRGKIFRVSCLSVLLSCGLISAQAEDRKLTPEEERFEKAFKDFCAPLTAPQPDVCKTTTTREFKASVSLRWLTLEEHCLTHSTESPCKALTDLKEELKKKKESPEPLVLAYDHVSGIWHARNRLAEDRVQKDVTGKPTVSLASNEELVVLLEHTNPLLYTLTPGAATEVDTPELADLKKLAGLVGGGISSVLKTLGQPPSAEESLGALDSQKEAIRKALRVLQQGVDPVQCTIEAASLQTSRIGHFVQSIELGGKADYPLLKDPTPCANLPAPAGLEADADNVFEHLSVSLQNSPEPDQLCLPFLQAAERAFEADTSKLDDILQAIRDAEGSAPEDTCAAEGQAVAKLLLGNKANPGPLLQMRQLIQQSPQPPDLVKKLEAVSNANSLSVKTLITLISRYKDLRAAAVGLLPKRDDARKAAAQVDKFDGALPQFLLGTASTCTPPVTGQCISSADISRQIVFVNDPKPVRFDKIQNHEIKINPNGFASAVVARQTGELKIEYALDSVIRGLWGVSASVVFTPLRDPTFTAVSDGPGTKTFHIAKTDEKTRAGQVALIMNYALGRRLCPTCGGFAKVFGLEWGAGIDKDKPALFGGFSWKLGKYVRLGTGVTYQQVTELKDQKVNDAVTATSDIKTRDTFKADYYISLSVVLESLSLFSSGS